jgi:hypothetical protein
MLVVFGRPVLGQDRVGRWQLDHESCSAISRILSGQPSAVLLSDALAQIQAESQPRGSLVAVRLNEAIENLVAAFDRHTTPVVAYGDDGAAWVRQPQCDLNWRFHGTELERIVNQV